MQLDQLEFVVKTEQLDAAITKVKRLGEEVGKLPKGGLGGLSGAGGSTRGAGKDVDEFEKKLEKLREQLKFLRNDLELSNTGFTKMQAGMLAAIKVAGAGESTIAAFATEFDRLNKITGQNPFDKSSQGLKKLENDLREIEEVTKYAAQGFKLTSDQVKMLSRDLEAMRQRNEAMGVSDKETTRLQREHIMLFAQKADQLNKYNAEAARSTAAAKTLASADAKLLEQEQKLVFTNKQLADGLSQGSANALYNYKKQIDSLALSTDQAAKRVASFREQLVIKQGYSPIKKLADDTGEVNKRLDHLSRALGPQITDIFVGLATGQSLLTVALQQGGQIRDQVALAGVESSKMGKALSDSAVLMVSSLKDVAVAMGSLLMTPFIAAGKAVTDLAVKTLFLSKTLQALSLSLAISADAGSKLAAGTLAVLSRFPAILGIVAAGFTSFGVAALVALYQVEKQTKELTKSLILTGGSLGLTTDSAMRLAASMEDVGVSGSKAIAVMTEMAKQGGFAAKEIELVTKSAADMQKWLGVSVEDTVKQFAKLKGEPVDALIEVAKQTGLVDVGVLATIISLAEQGRTAEASAIAMQTYGDITVRQVQRAKEEYTDFAKLMIQIGENLGSFWESIKQMWVKASPLTLLGEEIQNLNRVIDVGLYTESMGNKLKARRDALVAEYQMMEKKRLNEEQTLVLRTQDAKVMDYARKTTEQNLKGVEKLNAEYTRASNKRKELDAQRKAGDISEEAYTAAVAANKLEISRIESDIAKENKKNNSEAESAAKKLQKEIDAASEAYKDLMNVADGYSKTYNNTLEQLQLLLSLPASEGGISKTQFEEAKFALEQLQPYFKMSEDAFAKYNEEIEKHDKVIKDLQDTNSAEVSSLEHRASLLGKTSEEQRKLTIEYEKNQKLLKLEVQYQKELADLEKRGLDGQYGENKRSELDKQFADARVLIEKDANLKIAEDYVKKFEAIQKELGDVMFLALTNRGASAGKKLRDLIKAELMKPITVVINAVVNAMFGDAMKSLASSGGSVSGIMSAGSSLFKSGAGIGQAIGSGLSTIGGMVGSTGIQSFAAGAQYGQYGVNTMQSWAEQGIVEQSSVELAKSGATFAKYANTAADVLGYLNAFNTALKNPYKGAGQAIGTYFGGPIGSYIGGEIGQAVGDMMGYSGGDADAFLVQQAAGTNQAYRSSAQSRLGTVGFVRGNATIMKNGKLISEYGETQGLGTKTELAVLKTITALDNAIASTLSESQIKEIATNMSGWYQKSWSVESDTIENFIASRYETILGMLDSSFTKLKDYQKEGEKLADTAVRLVTNFSTMQNVFKDLGISTEVVTVTFATSLADMLGGIANFSSSMQYFYDNFFSEPEQIANQTRKLTETFDALGKTLPKTKQEFRTLLEGALSSGDKGLAASLLNIMPAFNDFIATTEEASTAMKDLTDSLLEEVNRLRGAILGSSSASGNVQGLTAEFAILTAQARAGNATAIEKLPEYSKAIEEAVLATATSSTDVLYARAWLANSLSNTSGVLTGIQPQAAVAAGSFTEDVASPVSASMTATGSVAGAGTTAQQDLIAALVAEVQGLRAEVRADVAANSKTSKILERANQDGETLSISGSIDGGTV